MSNPDPMDVFGKIRVNLILEIEPPGHDPEAEAAGHQMAVVKKAQKFGGTRLFTAEDAEVPQVLQILIEQLMEGVWEKVDEYVEAEVR